MNLLPHQSTSWLWVRVPRMPPANSFWTCFPLPALTPWPTLYLMYFHWIYNLHSFLIPWTLEAPVNHWSSKGSPREISRDAETYLVSCLCISPWGHEARKWEVHHVQILWSENWRTRHSIHEKNVFSTIWSYYSQIVLRVLIFILKWGKIEGKPFYLTASAEKKVLTPLRSLCPMGLHMSWDVWTWG